MKTAELIAVFITFPDNRVAADIISELVHDGLIACGNIVPQIRSIYLWQGEVQDDSEALAILKTTRDRLEEIQDRVVNLHPYDVPEIIAVDVKDGLQTYLKWVTESVSGHKNGPEEP